MEETPTIKSFAYAFMQEWIKNYCGPLYHYIQKKPELIKTVPGFLVNFEKIIMYIGRTHIGLEFIGPEFIDTLKSEGTTNFEVNDYTTTDGNLMEKIIGFEYDSTTNISMPLVPYSIDLCLPTNRGFDKLQELGWNFAAQNMIMGFNTPCPEPIEGRFTRIVNGMFFDANESGLKTRIIKWLDLFPIHFDDSDDETDSISFNLKMMEKLIEPDAHFSYPMPSDYKYTQLPKINRFIELWGNKDNAEPQITSFLAKKENEFILTMKFGANKIYSEILCEWQSEDREDIKPDFFVVQPNGYADIVEFKLPDLHGNIVVGTSNRERFSSWISSYIAQTRNYASYFDDPNNRKWFEDKYGFKVYKPRRWLVVGRRSDFNSDTWREIMSDYNNLEIMTFDDLIDGVIVQFYKN